MAFALLVMAAFAAQSGNAPGTIGIVFEGYDIQAGTPNGKSVVVPLAVFQSGKWIAGEKLQMEDPLLQQAREPTLKPPFEHWNKKTVFYPIFGESKWELPTGSLAMSTGIFSTSFVGFEGEVPNKEVGESVAVSTVQTKESPATKTKPKKEEILDVANRYIAELEKKASAPATSPLGELDDLVTVYRNFDASLGETPKVTMVKPFKLEGGAPAAWVVVEKEYRKRKNIPDNAKFVYATKFTARYHALIHQRGDTWEPIWKDGGIEAEETWSPCRRWQLLGISDVNADKKTEVVLESRGWEQHSYVALELNAKSRSVTVLGTLEGTI